MDLIKGKNSKYCCDCNELKHFENFWKKKSGKYGYLPRCINCEKVRRLKKKIINNQEKNRNRFKNWVLERRECNECREYKLFDKFYDNESHHYNIEAICKKCNNKKSKEYFENNPNYRQEYYQENKQQINKRNKEWYQNNKERRLKKSKEWYESNKERVSKRSKKYYEENKEQLNELRKKRYEENKEHELEINRKWYENNREKVRKYARKYKRKRRKYDKEFQILDGLQTRLSSLVSEKQRSKTLIKLLGCTREEFLQHIEDQFDEYMTWDNYGKFGWHIDHIIPCVMFDQICKYQRAVCWHYSNLQPLWADENWTKQGTLLNLEIKIEKEWLQKRGIR